MTSEIKTLSTRLCGQSKAGEFIKIMKIAANEWNLDIKYQTNFNTVKRIVLNSVKWT